MNPGPCIALGIACFFSVLDVTALDHGLGSSQNLSLIWPSGLQFLSLRPILQTTHNVIFVLYKIDPVSLPPSTSLNPSMVLHLGDLRHGIQALCDLSSDSFTTFALSLCHLDTTFAGLTVVL